MTPNDFMVMSNLGTTLSALQKFQEAKTLFTKVLEAEPHNYQLLYNRGNAYQLSGQFLKAIADYRKVLKINPQVFEAARRLGECLQQTGKSASAEKAFMLCISLAPRYPQAYISIAKFYRDIHQLDLAKIHYENALALAPELAEIHCDYAITLRDIGDLKSAKFHYEKAVALNPQLGRAWRGLSGLKSFKTLPELTAMQTALKDTTDPSAQMHLNFALGKAQEDIGDFDQAFAHYNFANLAQASFHAYKIEDDLAFFDNLKSSFTQDFKTKFSGEGCDTKRPIFVLGMPRSGTSLIEQILASHPKVYGAGELSALADNINRALPPRDDLDYTISLKDAQADTFKIIGTSYLKTIETLLNTQADYIVDKMPMNFMHIGIIALAMPNAKIIHCRREAMDNCLSIYKNHLAARGHGYAVELKTLGQYYRAYENLMAHWERLFEHRIYDVHYEKIVGNPEFEIKALLKTCELDFEDACLSPHKTQRNVSTLSAAQVRRPINSKSVKAWKNYEKHLAPLKRN